MYKHFIYIIFIIYFFASCNNNMKDKANNIIINLSSEPLTIDPTLNTDNWAGTYIAHAFEGLTQKDKDNNIIPGVAEKWEVSEDGLTYTFYLRTNAKWSDGRPVTAYDFAYAWKRTIDPKVSGKFGYLFTPIKNANKIISGELSSEQLNVFPENEITLKVVLENKTPYFIELTSFYAFSPVRKDVIEKYGDNWSLNPETYIGNGAFKTIVRKIDEKIVMIKNTNYWNSDNVKPEKLTFIMMEDPNAALSGIKNNSLQFSKSLSRNSINKLKNENIIKTVPIIATYHYRININNKILNDIKIRKALSLAIDRNYLISNVTKANENAAYNFVPYGIKDYKGDFRENKIYNEYISTNQIFNITNAKKLLSDAGYPDGYGFPVLDLITSTRDFDINVSEAIQEMWKNNLNIDVRINKYDYAYYLQYVHNRNFDIASHLWYGDFSDPFAFLESALETSFFNYGNYKNILYDKYVYMANETNNIIERMKLLHHAEQILINEVGVIPIYFHTEAFLVSPNLKDVEYDSMGMVRFHNAYLVN